MDGWAGGKKENEATGPVVFLSQRLGSLVLELRATFPLFARYWGVRLEEDGWCGKGGYLGLWARWEMGGNVE